MARNNKLVSLSSARPSVPVMVEEDAVALLTRIVAAQSEIAAAGPDPQDVVDAITYRAQELTRSAGAVLEIRDGEQMRYWSASGIAANQVGMVLPVKGSLSGRCLEEGRVMRCDDSETDSRVNRDACRSVGLRSMLVAPLYFRRQAVGVLKVVSTQPAAYGDTDQRTLDQLSTLVAASLYKAIEHAQMRAALDLRKGQSERERQQSKEGRARLEAVLEDDQLAAALQPIVRLEDGKVVGYEALARFPVEYDMSTGRWFEEAARHGMSIQLELAAARVALAHMKRIPADAYLAINASPETVCSDELKTMLKDHDPHRLVLEITEHTPVEDYSRLNACLSALQALGVRIAVDDTGAGFSSLRHVLRLAPDIIKLDFTLVREVDQRPRMQALIGALLTFARGTQAELVAEGVETPEQLETLRQLGVPYAQGYHLGYPQVP
ncbi:EAL domain-containing protein [Pseudoxanthomonas sp. PXM02]|uniref:sensor domain-containing phosphodiesterase n=1 Tax=Pseudoxanthomonas sp. PXM02 TaxID=2769294 RepID=UPI00177F6FDF|nr:EAL domain-containing protein [Pseudoxanthomonas sp. PXM02]MBD9477501.1 EAL domain-containing protein [Pseudoxanthomonas sp. PXM02]